MPAHILAITDRTADMSLANMIATRTGLQCTTTTRVGAIQNFLLDHPQAVVIWDAQDARDAVVTAKYLAGRINPARVFAITDGALNQYPHLFDVQVFGHHLQRRFADPAPELYTRLVVAALTPAPFGLARYFPKGTAIQKITLKHSMHKHAAVEALNNFLVKKGVASRLAALAAQAGDELLMNAIFDAPVDEDGAFTRRSMDRGAELELLPEGGVDMEIASSEQYTAICVADTYGSFRKERLMSSLRKDYQERNYVVREDETSAGLGIHGLIQAGLSILIVCEGGERTEVTVFFPSSGNYKEFRTGLRFLSMLMT